MDCCRDYAGITPGTPIVMDEKNANSPRVHFYAYGTQWDRRTRECVVDGEVRGIFSAALLEGLNGDASDPETNEVTAHSLWNYLRNAVPALSGNQQPQMEFYPGMGEGLIINRVNPKKHRVQLDIPAGVQGQQIFLLVNRTTRPPAAVYSGTPTGPRLDLELPRGVYYLSPSGQLGTSPGVSFSFYFSIPPTDGDTLKIVSASPG